MGKAGTWIRNLVLGRRTENHKKIKDKPFSEEHSATPAISSGTRKECQRWSFRRLSLSRTDNVAANKGTRSFNSIVRGQILEENVLFMEYQKDLEKNSSASSSSPTSAQVRKIYTISVKIPGLAQNAVTAATRIQAAYRSYLARRALRALRGLVKIQALVRGYLVRKRTNATLKSLHALISIQVRARIQRTQLVDQDIAYLNKDRNPGTKTIQHKQGFIIETNHPSIINTSQKKHNNNYKRGYHNDNQQFSESSRMHNSRINIVESHTSSGQHHDHLPFVVPAMFQAKSAGHILYHDDYPRLPSYMCNTESSKAKVRSQSEPKQRPQRSIKEKTCNRRSMSNIRMEVPEQDFQPRLHHAPFHARPHTLKKNRNNIYPWLIKLYRPTKLVMDDELSDSASTITSCTSILAENN